MNSLMPLISPTELALAFIVALVAGTVKGVVGFALPMILLSGLGMFMSPEMALAGLLVPTMVSNGIQALRHGMGAALSSIHQFRVFLGIGLLFLLASAQLVPILSGRVMYLVIGVPVVGFAAVQLGGRQWTLTRPSHLVEVGLGAFTGFIGGLSGIWGPPTVLYLNALSTPKAEHLRVQGVIYGMGAVALLGAHIASGVMRVETAPFSLVLVMPVLIGMWLGGLIQSRIDQVAFRRATHMVLLVAGLVLMWRGLMG